MAGISGERDVGHGLQSVMMQELLLPGTLRLANGSQVHSILSHPSLPVMLRLMRIG